MKTSHKDIFTQITAHLASTNLRTQQQAAQYLTRLNGDMLADVIDSVPRETVNQLIVNLANMITGSEAREAAVAAVCELAAESEPFTELMAKNQELCNAVAFAIRSRTCASIHRIIFALCVNVYRTPSAIDAIVSAYGKCKESSSQFATQSFGLLIAKWATGDVRVDYLGDFLWTTPSSPAVRAQILRNSAVITAIEGALAVPERALQAAVIIRNLSFGVGLASAQGDAQGSEAAFRKWSTGKRPLINHVLAALSVPQGMVREGEKLCPEAKAVFDGEVEGAVVLPLKVAAPLLEALIQLTPKTAMRDALRNLGAYVVVREYDYAAVHCNPEPEHSEEWEACEQAIETLVNALASIEVKDEAEGDAVRAELVRTAQMQAAAEETAEEALNEVD